MSEKQDSDTSALRKLSVGQCVSMACLLEATAPKPGNVHRGADFEDLSFVDFVVSAATIGPIFEEADQRRLGQTVLMAVRATRQRVRTNTNLGLVLALAPLAKQANNFITAEGVSQELTRLTVDDSRDVYTAIRESGAGGLGRSDAHDLSEPPPGDLLAAMRESSERDLIARQYANGFRDVFDFFVPQLIDGHRNGWSLTDAIVYTHVKSISHFGDSLIARKCGPEVASLAQYFAQRAVDAGVPGDRNYFEAVGSLDFWLRSDGHRRNPGTTADLVGAGLFVGLWNGSIAPPYN